jgi:TRAP-type C4-dicarboxylate transport system permease small subunit
MRAILDRFFKLLGALGAFFILRRLQSRSSTSSAASSTLDGRRRRLRRLLPGGGSFLALAYALRSGDHIRVTLILQRLRGRARWWMEVLCLAVATLLSSYFAWFSAKLVWGSYTLHDISQNVDATPLWIPQLSMALGLFGLALAFAEQLVETVRTGRVAVTAEETAHVE